MHFVRTTMSWLAIWMAPTIAWAQVRIVRVEQVPSGFNATGRLLKNMHPARFRILMHNQGGEKTSGALAAEVVGHLDTVYGLATQRLELAPGEERGVMVHWRYPGPITYDGAPKGPVHVPGARWGHDLKVAWLHDGGAAGAPRQTVFAVEEDGGAAKLRDLSRPLTPKEAFTLRWSGYLANVAFQPMDAKPDVQASLAGEALSKGRAGMGPSGKLTYLLELPRVGAPGDVNIEIKTKSLRLAQAWLLESPDQRYPRARRLANRANEMQNTLQLFPADDSMFTRPKRPDLEGAILVLELERAHHVPSIAVAEMAQRGHKQFGPLPPLIKDGDGKVGFTVEQFAPYQRRTRQAILTALGSGLGKEAPKLEPKVISEEAIGAQIHLAGLAGPYTRQRVSLQVRTGQRMDVWLLKPPGIGPFPAVVALHQTVDEGKDEPVALGGNHGQLGFGPFLASRGFVVIAPDSPQAGERLDHAKDSAYSTLAQERKDPEYNLLGQRLHDHLRVVDYLETLPFVNKRRIGVIGHSLGGESAAMLMAIDERLRAAVISCPFTLLQSLDKADETYALSGSTIFPGSWRRLLKEPPGKRKLPFDFDDVMVCWAPRPVFFHGVTDDLAQFTNITRTAQAVYAMPALYRFAGGPDCFHAVYSKQGHCFPGWVQPDAFDWLHYWLQETRRN